MTKTLFLLTVFTAVCSGQTPPTTLAAATPGDKLPGMGGFLQRWLLLDPIPVTGLTDSAVQATVKKDAYANLLQTMPTGGQKLSIDGAELTWHAMDTRNYNVNLYHFARTLGKKTSDILVWAVTVVHAPRDLENVRLAIGSNSASVWWVNGQEVIGIYGDRQTVIDDGVSRRLTLKKGPNVIRAAIVNGGGATDFCARLLDANDKPLSGLLIRLKDDSPVK
ncbi:MAG: acetylxylan esterase [Acidobacteria bacterium]|nr:acetylxylan esterase [Acidobacteriota bacterium]